VSNLGAALAPCWFRAGVINPFCQSPWRANHLESDEIVAR
jgi:hypothetical protein